MFVHDKFKTSKSKSNDFKINWSILAAVQALQYNFYLPFLKVFVQEVIEGGGPYFNILAIGKIENRFKVFIPITEY